MAGKAKPRGRANRRVSGNVVAGAIDGSLNSTTKGPSKRVVIAEFRRNARETVFIALDSYQGTPIFDVRCWWRDDAGDLRPGRSGLNLSIKHLPNLASGLARALEEAKVRGLLTEEPVP